MCAPEGGEREREREKEKKKGRERKGEREVPYVPSLLCPPQHTHIVLPSITKAHTVPLPSHLHCTHHFTPLSNRYQFTISQWIKEMMRPVTQACCEQLEILEMEHGDVLTLRGNPYLRNIEVEESSDSAGGGGAGGGAEEGGKEGQGRGAVVPAPVVEQKGGQKEASGVNGEGKGEGGSGSGLAPPAPPYQGNPYLRRTGQLLLGH